MNIEEATQEIGKPILRLLRTLQVFLIIAFLSSPFVWIYYNQSLALKIGLTGLFGTFIMGFIYKIAKEAISEAVDSVWHKVNIMTPESKFQKRLQELAKKRKPSTNN